MKTPAEASNPGNFIVDVPVQGPTDEGMRAADCWWVQHRIPTQKPACVDCEGSIPMWTRQSLVFGKGSGVGEQISFGGFAIGSPGDPEVYSHLSAEQQAWIGAALAKLNEVIVKTTGTTCPTWAPAIPQATGCFQGWFNTNKLGFTKADGSPLVLRTDGVFDQDTLDALRTVAALSPKDFPTPFPGTTLPGTGETKKKLSTGAMFGIAAAGAAAIGTVGYLVTRKPRRRRNRRR